MAVRPTALAAARGDAAGAGLQHSVPQARPYRAKVATGLPGRGPVALK